MIKLQIRTAYGDSYEVDAQGRINGSDNWLLIGFIRLNGTDRPSTRMIPLKALLAGSIPRDLLFKHGAPRYTILDLDHGTRRLHGNTAYHGIGACWLEVKE